MSTTIEKPKMLRATVRRRTIVPSGSGDLVVMFVAAVVAALFSSVAAAAQPATPGTTVDAAESCRTTQRADGSHVTQVWWESGRADRRVNMTARTRLFPGERELRQAPRRGSSRRIVGCGVLRNGTVQVRTKSRARYAFVPPAPTVPETSAPAAWGRWQVPVTLSTPGLDGSWQANAAAAAWNVGLPEGVKVTVTDAPCAEGQIACVPVAVEDLTGIPAEGLEPGGTAMGLAWPAYQDGVMLSCRIGLNAEVPVDHRFHVMAHELGHCLGLPHWDTEDHRSTVMTTRALTPSITPWDLAWVSAAYAGH